MQRRLRQACTAVKEHGSALAAAGGFGGIEAVVTKATSPSDVALHEKYVHELLKAFHVAGQSSLRRFTLSFTRRFGRTKSWRVALKCLLLLHRLMRSELGHHFRSELLCSRANGLISLHPCRFLDESSSSSSSSETYTAFVRSYAHFLDESLNCTAFALDEKVMVEPRDESFPEKMKEVGRVLELLPQQQSLIDRVMECRPVGSAARSFVVKAAMKRIVRDSFECYATFRREVVVVLDSLFQMPYRSCVQGFGIYKKASCQAERLCEFYGWCKEMGFCGIYEYPFVERIPALQIKALESFFNGMWQFTDSSEASSSSSSVEDGGFKDVGREKREFCLEEEGMLIQWEDETDGDESWETLLEASIQCISPFHANRKSLNSGFWDQMDARNVDHGVANPFYQSWMMQESNALS